MIKTLKDVEYEEYSKWFEKEFKAFPWEKYNAISIIDELLSIRKDPAFADSDMEKFKIITFKEWKEARKNGTV
jgi:hypothetical protein